MSQPARFFHHGKWVHRGAVIRAIFARLTPAQISGEIATLRRELPRSRRSPREEAICAVYLGVLRASLRRKLAAKVPA